MTLPRGNEYNEAVQNPQIAFIDNDLKISSVETTPLGLPKPYSGGFTITYKLLLNSQKSYAVRCFYRDIQNLQQRYKVIGDFLTRNRSRYFVEAKYLADGIRVNGKEYPIIKMHWINGDPLNIYLGKVFYQKEKIENILTDFLNLISELDRYGIAHGDLQHGNIIVKNDQLFLIDYDGMYFPELSHLKTNEIGHINYQHPNRLTSHYSQCIDRFSAIIIYIGLKAISINPNLWKTYDNGENILFCSRDFVDIQHSSLFQDLSKIPELKSLIEKLKSYCHFDFEKIPSLKEFISGNFVSEPPVITQPPYRPQSIRSQYPIFDVLETGNILEHFGEKIEVVGKISGKHLEGIYNGSPYMFLYFWLNPNQTFRLVFWKEGVTALRARGISASSLHGKYVSVTGVISSHNHNPQMIIESPQQIQILKGGEKEAKERLTYKNPVPPDQVLDDKTIKKLFDILSDSKLRWETSQSTTHKNSNTEGMSIKTFKIICYFFGTFFCAIGGAIIGAVEDAIDGAINGAIIGAIIFAIIFAIGGIFNDNYSE
jgi:hypothetical protein